MRKFQTSPHVRVGLLSMTPAGVGLTLTAASNVMFAELHYTPGVLAQAEDRARRIGRTNIFIIFVIVIVIFIILILIVVILQKTSCSCHQNGMP